MLQNVLHNLDSTVSHDISSVRHWVYLGSPLGIVSGFATGVRHGKLLNCPVTSQYSRDAGAHMPTLVLLMFIDAYKKQYICEGFDNSQMTLGRDVCINLARTTVLSLNAVERRTLRHLSCLLRSYHSANHSAP